MTTKTLRSEEKKMRKLKENNLYKNFEDEINGVIDLIQANPKNRHMLRILILMLIDSPGLMSKPRHSFLEREDLIGHPPVIEGPDKCCSGSSVVRAKSNPPGFIPQERKEQNKTCCPSKITEQTKEWKVEYDHGSGTKKIEEKTLIDSREKQDEIVPKVVTPSPMDRVLEKLDFMEKNQSNLLNRIKQLESF